MVAFIKRAEESAVEGIEKLIEREVMRGGMTL